jgi:hypothetical protein
MRHIPRATANTTTARTAKKIATAIQPASTTAILFRPAALAPSEREGSV